jgi:hypothetical protein
MAIIDLVGAPIPIGLPEFENDTKLQKKIRQLESLIEIKHDMEDGWHAVKALRNSLKNENQQTIMMLLNAYLRQYLNAFSLILLFYMRKHLLKAPAGLGLMAR